MGMPEGVNLRKVKKTGRLMGTVRITVGEKWTEKEVQDNDSDYFRSVKADKEDNELHAKMCGFSRQSRPQRQCKSLSITARLSEKMLKKLGIQKKLRIRTVQVMKFKITSARCRHDGTTGEMVCNC